MDDFCKFHSTLPPEHTVAGNMYTHSMSNYERISKEGLSSYTERIKKIADADIREGLIHLLDGIKTLSKRCVARLESSGTDEKLTSALKKVPFMPADNIYEAIVGRNFIMYLDNCNNLGYLASELSPYFHGENIVALLKNLYDNIDSNGGYSMSLDSSCIPLTLMCLEAAKGKRRPMIELLINKNPPPEIWNKAFEVIGSGGSQPAFYNEFLIKNGLKERIPDIKTEDLSKFCGGGCTETMLGGLSNVGSLDAGINLLLILENTMYENLPSAESFEEFYNIYIRSVGDTVDTVTAKISRSQKLRAEYNPIPMRTLLIDDCIKKSADYNGGGARYMWSIINFAGLINVIDSMLAIRNFIFSGKLHGKQLSDPST